MTKQLAIGGLILWLLSQGSIVLGETYISAEYFPLDDWNSWTYQVTGTFGTYNETITVLPGTTNINGVATKAIQYSDGDLAYYTSDKNGIRYHGAHEANPPPILTLTLAPPLVEANGTMRIPEIINSSGTAWLTHETAGTFRLDYTAFSATEAFETVMVPAGTYDTIRLRDSTNIIGNILGDLFNYVEWGETWLAKYIGVVKQTINDVEGSAETWVLISTNVVPPVDLSGTIKTSDGKDICAMVLASGQYTFSCNPPGVFSLTGLPRRSDGTVKRQIYAHGFFPKIDTLPDSTNEDVVMTRSGICPNYNLPYDPAFVPGSAGKEIYIAGEVLLQNTQTSICAMVLANGQYMFSCDGTGSYFLKIPLDNNGQFKLQVYADGFAPSIRTFDEFKTTNIVRMARAVECQ